MLTITRKSTKCKFAILKLTTIARFLVIFQKCNFVYFKTFLFVKEKASDIFKILNVNILETHKRKSPYCNEYRQP